MGKRKRTLLTSMMEAGDLTYVGNEAIGYHVPGAPDYLYLFSKEWPPHFLAFTTPDGLVYQCDGCGGLHIFFWRESDCQLAPDMPRHASRAIQALWEELRSLYFSIE